jgi:hypothetical protein
LVLLFVWWLIVTPWLWVRGVFDMAPFFGVSPTHDQEVQAVTFLRWAVACGLLVPMVGLVLALVTSRRVAAWFFGVAVALSVVAVFATGTVQLLNGITNRINSPTTSVVTPSRTPCAEHSGGVPRCPGD